MTDMWEGTEFEPGTRRKISPVPDLRIPEDPDAEASYLSTLIFYGASPRVVEISTLLQTEDFHVPQHQFFFSAIKSLLGKGVTVNSLTLKDEMEKQNTLGRVGGFVGIVELCQKEDVDNPEYLAGIIREKSRLRSLIHTASKIIEEASGSGEYVQIVSDASEAITRLAIEAPQRELITDLSDLVDDLVEGKALTAQNGGRALSWGDPVMDEICPIPRGEPTLVTARPGVGKSAMALQIIVSSVRAGIARPLFLSLEMGREKIKARVAGHLTSVNSRQFRDAKYGASEIQKIIEQQDILKGIKTMFPRQQCQIEEIETLVAFAIERYGIDSVILDQFNHIAPPKDARKENYAIQNAAVSKRLTALAKNHNLGWVTLAQINKDGDDSRRPTMKDLAATDRLAMDAAVIFGMWNKGTDENQEVWGTFMKTRDEGYKGWAKQLSTDYGTCSFRVMERETAFGLPRF